MNLLATRLYRCALRRRLAAACGIPALVVGTAAAFAQPTITDLPALNLPYATPYAVSLGGSTVVGSSSGNSSEFLEQAWRWTSVGAGAGVTEDLGFIYQPHDPCCYSYVTRAYAVSADGSVVAGWSEAVYKLSGNTRAFRWTHDGGIQDFGNGWAYGVSGDGSVVVGYANNCCGSGPLGACRWTSDGTAHVFGTPSTSPMGCNFDGSVVTGSIFDFNSTGQYHAFRWSEVGGMQDLGTLPGGGHPGAYTVGTGISADGSTVVGFADTVTGTHAFRWTESGGMQNLGLLPGGADYARAFSVSADGQVVVGDSAYPGWSAAFVWTPNLGMVDLREYLASQGVDVTDFYPWGATGISPDGSAVVCAEYYTARLVRGLTFGCLELPVQPSPQTTCASGTATFSVTAAGSSPFTYQWQWQQVGAPNVWTTLAEGPNADSGGVVRFIATGAATPTVGIARDNTAQGALDVVQALRCIVTNACGSVMSNAATLTVFDGGGGDGTPNCDDGNVCTDDSCDPATGCHHVNNSNSCDDSHACTRDDVCAGGSCSGTPIPVCIECNKPGQCDDGNGCTTDTCEGGSCVFTNNTEPCDDGDACTTDDTCSAGACISGPPLDCDDDNVCTDDSCDPATGCVYVDNTAPCDDGNACTHTDTCSGGACAGMDYTCDDSNVCTDDSCNGDDTCNFTDNTVSCDDGDACTTNDACQGGACVSSITYGLDAWRRMSKCLAGPETQAADGCECSDLADDGYVDLQDVAEFMRRFDGN